MENKLALQFPNSIFFLVIFGHGKDGQVKLVSVVNWQFRIGSKPNAFEDVVDDFIPLILGTISVIVFGGDVEYELVSDLTDAQSLDAFIVDSSFDISSFEVVDGMRGDKKASLLFFLIVVELENGTAH